LPSRLHVRYNEPTLSRCTPMQPVSDAERVVDEMVSRIREAVDPERIILFGSRARGTARPDSDFDLLIVKDSSLPRYRRAAPLYAKLADLPVEVNILVYTPSEIAEWSAVRQAFVTSAIREGKVLYERES